MSLSYIQSKNELTTHIHSGKDFFLMVSTTTCPPCKRFTPVVESVSGEFRDITFCKVNLDEVSDALEVLGVGSVPTIILWRDGKELHRSIGAMSKDELVGLIKSIFV